MSQDDVIDCLNTLIETSKDGEFGFRTSAEQTADAQLKQLLLQRADECRSAATELQALVRDHGGSARPNQRQGLLPTLDQRRNDVAPDESIRARDQDSHVALARVKRTARPRCGRRRLARGMGYWTG